LKQNLRAAGVVGSLVGTDYKSVMFVVPLLEKNPETGRQFDYGLFSRMLESEVRQKYEFARGLEKTVAAFHDTAVKVHVVGLAALVGDLIDGLGEVMTCFAFAAVVAAAIIFFYTRCVRSTALVLACSIVAVVWQVGIISALGFELDPYSILVPFLVF